MNKRALYMIITLVAVILIPAIIISLIYNKEARLISASPKDSEIDVSTTLREVSVEFDTKQGNYFVENSKIEPKIRGKWVLSEDKKVGKYVINENLGNYQTYKVTINYSNSLGKKSYTVFHFKTKFVNFVDLPPETQKRQIEETDTCSNAVLDRTLCDE